MYKILIVDDNKIICEGLRFSIDHDLPVTVCAVAYDGMDAKEKIEQHHPEIVITDIRMPKCSGLELAQWINENQPNTKTIIISSYDDFSYAKDALRFQCLDYLLKPTEPEELNLSIRKAIAILDREAMQRNRQTTETAILNACCYGNAQKISLLPVHLQALPCCAVATLHSPTSITISQPIGSMPVFCAPGEYFDTYIFFFPDKTVDTRKIIHFFSSKQSQPNLGIIGIGEPCASVKELQHSRRGAQDACLYGLIFPHLCNAQKIIFANQLPKHAQLKHLTRYDTEFKYCFLSRDLNRIRGIVENAMTDAIEISASFRTLQTVSLHFLSLANSLNPLLFEEDEIERCTSRQWFIQQKTITGIISALASIISQKCSLGKKNDGSVSAQISDVQSFILQNISESLSLESIAKQFHLSPNYLSTQYKKHTGKTIVQEITDLRIDCAKQRLSNTILSMHDIAESVGFNSTEYFFRIFKKYTGMTPGEFRAKSKEEDSL